MPDRPIRAVVFDVGGTLLTFQATPEADRRYIAGTMALLEEHGIAVHREAAELLSIIEAGAKRYKRFSEMELKELDPDTIWGSFILEELGFPKERFVGLGEPLSFLYDREKREIAPRPELRETLEALRARGIRLAIISNVMSTSFIPWFLRENGVEEFFEEIQMSSLSHVRKPNPEMFDRCLNALKLTNLDVLYVGDTLSRDVRGARAAHWPVVQIDNPAVYHRDAAFVGQVEPDARITDLRELLTLVDSWPSR